MVRRMFAELLQKERRTCLAALSMNILGPSDLEVLSESVATGTDNDAVDAG